MFLYKSTIGEFCKDVDENIIFDLVELAFERELGRRIPPAEKRSITNSMSYMERVVRRSKLDSSCGVLVEYVIPSTSNRVDFFVSGHDEHGNENFVIVELKQWETAYATEKDGIVSTFLGKGIRETNHPSYQASSYKMFLADYNENIDNGNLQPFSCAYLHNFKKRDPEPLEIGIYEELVKDSPIYFKDDQVKLEEFLSKYVGKGDGEEILYKVEMGKIRPSKKLIDHVIGMFEGNKEFILLDEQKLAYETAKYVAEHATKKEVVIIKGGPGTGKSVVSVNLLGGLLQSELNSVFVAPNASFRDVMIHKLSQEHRRNRLHNLFKGSAGFLDAQKDTFDVIIVDEAHRLKNDKAYQYRGSNQVADIINAGRTSIFFIDDNQIIRPEDIGSVDEIKRIAELEGAHVQEIELQAQFRCSGAEGYLNWIDHTLQIKDTANFDGWGQTHFDFKIFDNPKELFKAIRAKHDEGQSARMLAGYAWQWTSSKDGNFDAEYNDVTVPDFEFSMPWNSRRVGTTWAIDPKGIDQIGCIHTSQGLEFDYVGVIVGSDLKFDYDNKEFYTEWSEYKDRKGKQGLKQDPERLNRLVRNIYKVLLTRGMKGCYVYFVDKDLAKYMRERLKIAAGLE